MQRPFVLLVSLLGLWGCQSTPATTDPFLRTTVPPPGTGAAHTSADPYYPASHSTPATSQGVTPASAPVVPPPSKFNPPGGSYNYQSSIDRPRAGASGIRRGNGAANSAATTVADAKSPSTSATAAKSNVLPPASADLRAANVGAAGGAALASATAAISDTDRGARVDRALATAAWVEDDSTHESWAKAIKKADENPIKVTGFREVASTTAAPPVASAGQITNPFAARAAAAAEQDEAVASADDDNTQEYRPVANSFAANRSAAPADEGSVIRILEPTSQRTERTEWTEQAEADEPAENTTWTNRAVRPVARETSPEPAQGASNFAFKESTPAPQDLSKLPRAEILSRSWPSTSPKSAAESGLTRVVTGGTLHDANRTNSTSAFTASSSNSSYGYNPDYQSLRGKLEYSQASRQWKLRYIPIDGRTDQFGGSVVLPSSTKLEGFQPGDFVTVEGAPGNGRTSLGFSPTYDLRQIAKLR